ncbi:DUF2478 domain-containing protein [Azonexus sp.]|uniref:DUF2478 domain-containing protein n=1 Tax=Azonexus sp. TaxID=1872668 RepID=UPI0035B2DBCD
MMPPADHDPELPPIATIVATARGAADTALRDFVADLRRRGVRVRGLLQESQPDSSGCRHLLVDIESGRHFPISQQLGSQSNACTLDTAALVEATSVLRRIADEGADLAVFNRFSKLESSGEGFAAEMLQVMSNGIPVLTITPPAYLESWRHFTGGIARELPPDAGALNDWFAA